MSQFLGIKWYGIKKSYFIQNDEEGTLRLSSCGSSSSSGNSCSSGWWQLVTVSCVTPLATHIATRTSLYVRIDATNSALTPTVHVASATIADVRAAILVRKTWYVVLINAITIPCALVVNRRHVTRIILISAIVITSARVKERIRGLRTYVCLTNLTNNLLFIKKNIEITISAYEYNKKSEMKHVKRLFDDLELLLQFLIDPIC